MLGDLTGFWRHLTVNTTLKPTNSSTRFALISHHLNVMFQRNIKTQRLIRHCQTEVNQSVGLPAGSNSRPASFSTSVLSCSLLLLLLLLKMQNRIGHTHTDGEAVATLPPSLSLNKQRNKCVKSKHTPHPRPSLPPSPHLATLCRPSTWQRQHVRAAANPRT